MQKTIQVRSKISKNPQDLCYLHEFIEETTTEIFNFFLLKGVSCSLKIKNDLFCQSPRGKNVYHTVDNFMIF